MKDNKIEVMKEKQGGSATLENVVLFAVSKNRFPNFWKKKWTITIPIMK
ncbi:hypothetical protein P7H25_01785 [Paenibacillus larvae]|nr:hypothetical protein [Paenibacillus larvae]MDT2237213.1 hypothetical protein [Paenibacillus larvae]MDT2241656.1 hypothetical protein [Paenibacillus larvae]MDT2254635.1 hypothetical protein [Paenibacillus larvae]